jgi:hypothetical protein
VVTCSRWGHLAADGAVLGRRGSRRRCSPRAVPLWLLAAGHLLAAVAGSALGTCSSTCLALGSRLPPPGTCGAGDLSCRRCSPRHPCSAPVFCIVAKEQTAKKVLGAGLLLALYK